MTLPVVVDKGDLVRGRAVGIIQHPQPFQFGIVAVILTRFIVPAADHVLVDLDDSALGNVHTSA